VVLYGQKLLEKKASSLGEIEEWDVQEQVFTAALDTNNLRLAMNSLTKIKKQFGDNGIRVRRLSGLFREAQGKWKDAEAIYKSILEDDPVNSGAMKRQIAIRKAIGDNTLAIKLLNEYLLMHFGSKQNLDPFHFVPEVAFEFPARCAELCISSAKKYGVPFKRVLDLGCAVGRSSFDLSVHFEQVVGIDYSQSFINAANQLKADRKMDYLAIEEGEVTSKAVATLGPDVHPERTLFQHGDACNLSEELGEFDVILQANLLCRLPNPQKCLDSMKRLVKIGGLIVITTPCTWSEAYTPKANWLGGFVSPDGSPVATLQSLSSILPKLGFELLETGNLPFVIREHARKYQLTIAQSSIWQRKS